MSNREGNAATPNKAYIAGRELGAAGTEASPEVAPVQGAPPGEAVLEEAVALLGIVARASCGQGRCLTRVQ